MSSGLLLTGGTALTLSEVVARLDLSAARLVSLSACEIGLTDFRESPDEWLPAGFMQAGAPAVIGTLWAVNDLSTMLLMERFYQLHLQGGLDIPRALLEAQIWLRDVSAGSLAERFRQRGRGPCSAKRECGGPFPASNIWRRFALKGSS
jgi:CHAT domain-containing protein